LIKFLIQFILLLKVVDQIGNNSIDIVIGGLKINNCFFLNWGIQIWVS